MNVEDYRSCIIVLPKPKCFLRATKVERAFHQEGAVNENRKEGYHKIERVQKVHKILARQWSFCMTKD